MSAELIFKSIQKRLRALRGRALTDLAQGAGVSRATVYELRKSRTGHSVRVHTLIALERALERDERHRASNSQKASRTA